MIGRPRAEVVSLPAYRPGKAAAQAEAEHNITNAIKLASNETAWPPIDAVLNAIRQAADGVNRYADHRATALREALGKFLDVETSHVGVGCGSVGLLQQLCLSYVNPGDEVAYPWRSFEVYPVYTQLVGGVSATAALRDHTVDLDALAAVVTERTPLVLIANPNNPTGTAVSTDALATFVEGVDPDTIVVVDEAYREFIDPALGNPVTDLLPRFPNVVVLRTFSKAHGLAGLRVGYAVGDPSVIETIDKTLFPFAVNALAQAGAMAAIASISEIESRVQTVLAERTRVVAALLELNISVPVPNANFVWIPFGPRTDAVYLELEKQGVVTRPFSGEGIRVTIGLPDENSRFLEALEGALVT